MWNLKCVVNFQTELPFCFSGKCSFTPISIAVWQNVLLCMSRLFFLYCAFQKTAVHAVGWNFGVRCISYKPTERFHFPPMMEKESRGNTECIFTFKVAAFRIRCLSLQTSPTRNCGPVQSLIIYSGSCACLGSPPWLFTYLEVCLPLGLHLQLTVQHSLWRVSRLSRITSASRFSALFNLLGSHWQHISL